VINERFGPARALFTACVFSAGFLQEQSVSQENRRKGTLKN
jgi:hypothetical protein